jgi:hypothetical protein
MTLPSSVDIIRELPSLVKLILLIGCRFDTKNSEMTVGCEDGEAKSGPRSTIVMWDPVEGFDGEAPMEPIGSEGGWELPVT